MGLVSGLEALVIARVSAVLAPAGAWDIAVPIVVCAGAEDATFHFTYIRGAIGGAFDAQLQVSPYSIVGLVPAGGSEWVTASLYAAGILAAGVDTQSRIQRDYMTYGSIDGAIAAFVYGPIRLGGMIERLRITARESGVIATPGTLQCEVALS